MTTKQARFTFSVKTRKIKIIFASMAIVFFVAHLIGGMVRGLGIRGSLLISTIGSLGLLLAMWIYGECRTFGFEWRLYEDGLEILRKGQRVNFVDWKNIAKIETGALVIVTRDGSRFPITLSRPLQREMRQKILEIMSEEGIVL